MRPSPPLSPDTRYSGPRSPPDLASGCKAPTRRWVRYWTPVTVTYDDIINSGRLLYVENQQLRIELSRFRKSLELVRQMERLQAETFYERQMPFLAENQDTNYSTWSEVYRPPVSPFSVDTAPFATLKYWNLVVEWIYVHVDVITNYRRAVADCDRILEIIENELESKAN